MADIDIELLVIFGVFALGIFYLLLRLWPRAATEPDRGPSSEQYPKVVFERPYNRADSTDQLRAVMAATFTPRKVMQSAEYRAFLAVEQEVHASWRGCRVFAQTALGEVIESQDRAAHSAIHSKRADFLVIRPNGLPALAIEYQGQWALSAGRGRARRGQERGIAQGRRRIPRSPRIPFCRANQEHGGRGTHPCLASRLNRRLGQIGRCLT